MRGMCQGGIPLRPAGDRLERPAGSPSHLSSAPMRENVVPELMQVLAGEAALFYGAEVGLNQSQHRRRDGKLQGALRLVWEKGIRLPGELLEIAEADIGWDNGGVGGVAARKERGGREGAAAFDLVERTAAGQGRRGHLAHVAGHVVDVVDRDIGALETPGRRQKGYFSFAFSFFLVMASFSFIPFPQT